jgi:hypothetical protein
MAVDGNLTFPGSKFGFTRHACTIDQITWGFLAHKIFRPATREISAQASELIQDGVHSYDDIQIITHRTNKKFVSFSWTNHVMGMLIPIGAGHETNPDFTTPIRDGFVGSFNKVLKNRKTSVVSHNWQKTTNGFETTGVLLLNDGELQQTLHVTSIGKQAVVYEDRVTARRNATIKEERGLPLGIENDRITGGTRIVYYQNGSRAFNQDKPQQPTVVSGSWANVDGRLGLVVVSGSGISYNQTHDYSPGISVCEDVLYGSFSDKQKHAKAGDEIARRVAIVLDEITPEQTAAVAKSVSLKKKHNTTILQFQLPEGGTAEVILE